MVTRSEAGSTSSNRKINSSLHMLALACTHCYAAASLHAHMKSRLLPAEAVEAAAIRDIHMRSLSPVISISRLTLPREQNLSSNKASSAGTPPSVDIMHLLAYFINKRTTSSSQMAHVQNLPIEILLAIPLAIPEIANMRRVCRRFGEVFAPPLFKNIVIRRKKGALQRQGCPFHGRQENIHIVATNTQLSKFQVGQPHSNNQT